jgi:hypothetical protein
MEAIALVREENHSHNIMSGRCPHTPFTSAVRPIFLITFRRRPSFLKATSNQAIRKGSQWYEGGGDGGGNWRRKGCMVKEGDGKESEAQKNAKYK